ncbi:MAG: class B sortase [Parasporobacterium sp.]|nr:class B sortase [Parasporobacterium sp.]
MKRSSERPVKRRKGIPTYVLVTIILAAVCVLIVCAFKLISISNSYKAADDAYAAINQMFKKDKDKNQDQKKGLDVLIEESDFEWDFDALVDYCSDSVGYIFQEGVMSYPIVQAEDNDKYLRNLMNGEYNVAGTLFVDCRFPKGLEGKYSIIYGHNMYNITMFGTIPEYVNEEYYRAHPTFDIFVGYKHYRYHVFSAFVADAEGYVYTYDVDEMEPADRKAFFDQLRADGEYETDFRELTADDNVVVLSTCVTWKDYSLRNVVCLVRAEEIVGW